MEYLKSTYFQRVIEGIKIFKNFVKLFPLIVQQSPVFCTELRVPFRLERLITWWKTTATIRLQGFFSEGLNPVTGPTPTGTFGFVLRTKGNLYYAVCRPAYFLRTAQLLPHPDHAAGLAYYVIQRKLKPPTTVFLFINIFFF